MNTAVDSGLNFRASFMALICILSVAFLTVPLHASTLVYTVQAGSFDTMDKALKQYNSFLEKAAGAHLDHLRIEKVGNYYAVRVGNFMEQSPAELLLETVRSVFPQAILMQAYFLDERIMKLHIYQMSGDNEDEKSNEPKETEEVRSPPFQGDSREQEVSSVRYAQNGDTYVKENRLVSAAEEYQMAITNDPRNADLYVKLSRILKELNLVEEAIHKMEEAVALSSGGKGIIQAELGRLYLTEGDSDKAEQQFLDAMNARPGEGEIHYYLGAVYLKKGMYDKAWFAARTAEKMGYDSGDLMNVLLLLSEEPVDAPWQKALNELYIRHIVIQSHENADRLLQRILEEGLFGSGIRDNADTMNRLEAFEGRVDPGKIHPKIANVLLNQHIFDDPVMIETEYGYHIVQRILPLQTYIEQ